MRYYIPAAPRFRVIKQKPDCQKLTIPAPVDLGRTAPMSRDEALHHPEVGQVAAKAPPRPNARAHRFLDQMEAAHRWWTEPAPAKATAVAPAAPAPATVAAREKPLELLDLQDLPDALAASGYKISPALMRKWFSNPAFSAQSQEQKECLPGAPFYPATLVDSSTLKMADLLKLERIQAAFDKLRSREFLDSKPVRDALYKVCARLPAGTVDVDPASEFGGDLQKMHRRYAFASATVGKQFLQGLEDIRVHDLGKSGDFADDMALALGEFRLYVAIQDAHVFYNGRTTRRVQVKEVAIYTMAAYGFDAVAQGTPYLGHFNKKHFALVTDGEWVHAPVYTGKDVHAKNAVLRPATRPLFMQWRQQHKQGGDMLLFSDRRPSFPDMDVVVPLATGEPQIAILGRVAADPFGRVVSPNKPSLHFTLVISYPNGDTFGIDGQPTLDVGELKYDESGPYAAAFGPVPINMADALRNTKLIKSNFYRNAIPDGIVQRFEIQPPAGMDAETFANSLIAHAHNFASYTVGYSAPKNIGGSTMLNGEYNSSSYLAGLLISVTGSIPQLHCTGYQTPGWENPIPTSYFKGEALR